MARQKTYTVIFKKNGEVVKTEIVKEGESATAPAVEVREWF